MHRLDREITKTLKIRVKRKSKQRWLETHIIVRFDVLFQDGEVSHTFWFDSDDLVTVKQNKSRLYLASLNQRAPKKNEEKNISYPLNSS